MRLEDKSKEHAEEETHFSEELRLKSEKEEQERLKAEEETCIGEKLKLKAEAGGFCGAGVER